jgi:hypothetical protein
VARFFLLLVPDQEEDAMNTECPGCQSLATREAVRCGACRQVYHSLCFEAAGCLVPTCRKFGMEARPAAARVSPRPTRAPRVSRPVHAHEGAHERVRMSRVEFLAQEPEREAPPISRLFTALGLVLTGLTIIGTNLVPVWFWTIYTRMDPTMRAGAFANLPLVPAMLGLIAGMRVTLMLPLTTGWRWLLLASWLVQAMVACKLFHVGMAVVAAAGAGLHWIAYVLHARRSIPLFLRTAGVLKFVECTLLLGSLIVVLGASRWVGVALSPLMVCVMLTQLLVGLRLALMLMFPNPEVSSLVIGYAFQAVLAIGVAFHFRSEAQLRSIAIGGVVAALVVAARWYDREQWAE